MLATGEASSIMELSRGTMSANAGRSTGLCAQQSLQSRGGVDEAVGAPPRGHGQTLYRPLLAHLISWQ